MQPADFPNIKTLTLVGNHYVGNLLGHLDAALAVANSPDGGVYPVGTIIQLVPQEAMVKRARGMERGQPRLGVLLARHVADGHQDPDPRRDPGAQSLRPRLPVVSRPGRARNGTSVCEKDHGCDPIPLTDQLILALQQGDPRPTS